MADHIIPQGAEKIQNIRIANKNPGSPPFLMVNYVTLHMKELCKLFTSYMFCCARFARCRAKLRMAVIYKFTT